MFCAHCGKEIMVDSNYCPYCGSALSPYTMDRGPLKFKVKYSPSYSLLEVDLLANGHIVAEAGALTYMSNNIDVKTRTRMQESGIWGTIKVSLLGGETLFINDYIASGGPGKIGFVSAPLGDITHLAISPNKGYIIQSSAYIASTPDVTLDTQWQGFTKGLFG